MTQQKNPRKTFGYRINRGMLSLSRNWLRVVLVFFGFYATLPIAAPMFMSVGLTGAGNALYTLYSPMCHQFAFRSIFLFGEQTFYPREIVGTELRPYEAYAAELPDVVSPESPTDFSLGFIMSARAFRGNDDLGYKTAVCARDVAIYNGIFIGGLIFAIPLVRRRLRPLPLILYVIIGLGPIGLDGFSQLLSYDPFNFWPVRETHPFFRVATGALFGLMTAWLAFPHLAYSMEDTRYQLEAKFRDKGYDV